MNLWPFKKKLDPMHPLLGRRVEFDERSKNYPVRAVVAEKKPRSYTWKCATVLDQGDTPSCVGNAWAHELIAKPVVEPHIDEATAFAIYKSAQLLDQWPGENYDGTSVLAGAKAVVQMDYMAEYRWCFGLDDLILSVGHLGPVVIGINWYQSMFDPDSKGLLHINGEVAGGHAILVNGVNIKQRLFRVHQSWGQTWGINGEAFITFDDMTRLLGESGEAVIPLKRKLIK
jgi:hypothetical protein